MRDDLAMKNWPVVLPGGESTVQGKLSYRCRSERHRKSADDIYQSTLY